MKTMSIKTPSQNRANPAKGKRFSVTKMLERKSFLQILYSGSLLRLALLIFTLSAKICGFIPRAIKICRSLVMQGLTACFFLISGNAIAEMIEVIPHHYKIVERYVTSDEAQQACISLASSLNYASYYCHQTGTYPGKYWWEGGWFLNPSKTEGYLGIFYFCPAGQRYFEDVKYCVLVTQLPPLPKPAGNGPNCPACGEPINPGNGNMWHTEPDYAVPVRPGGLSVVRTYNSNPSNWDANVVRAFGARSTSRFDSILMPETVHLPSGICWRREDTKYVWCESPVESSENPLESSTLIPDAVTIVRGDGKKYMFNRSGQDYIGDADTNDRVTAHYAANGSIIGWTYKSAEGDVAEGYDANGRLISSTTRAGAVQRPTYSDGITNDSNAGRVPPDAPVCSHVQAGTVLPAGRLLCVTDNWGGQLQFEYDVQGRVIRTIDPANYATTYSYDGPSGGCTSANPTSRACFANNLTQVTYPDGKSKTYYYNELSKINNGSGCVNAIVIGNGFGHLINALTGLVDENGARHITWTYDCLGRAASSSLGAGMEKVDFLYGVTDSTGMTPTTVTHWYGNPALPQAVSRNYRYATISGLAKNLSIDQPCLECGDTATTTYDVNANPASRTDWKGNKTTYVYDLERNLETSRTEAAGTPQAKTISTQWHPTYRLPVTVTEPGKVTSFIYDASGNMLQKTITAGDASRVWSYTYNSVGQVLTVTGPRTDVGDVTKYAYDGQGNLVTVTNAAGQVTTLSHYDANGRVGRIADPNGLITDLTYSPRGWLTSKSVGGEVTNYGYDGVGQLTQVASPDGSTLAYTYDDAHRLIKVEDGAGNKIIYTLDLRGNRLSEKITDPNGALVRETTRVFDTLSRLQKITGGQQ